MLTLAEKLNVQEYFELEQNSEVKHEFVHGTLIEMPGEKKKANKIAKNCLIALDKALEGKGQEIYTHDVRLEVEANAIYRYPDLVIAPSADDTDEYNVKEPILIIEVLSDSTEKTDRGKKLTEYSNIPSLQYYLIVSQNEPLVEVYSRKNGDWIFTFCTKLTENIDLPFFPATLPLQKIYDYITFPEK